MPFPDEATQAPPLPPMCWVQSRTDGGVTITQAAPGVSIEACDPGNAVLVQTDSLPQVRAYRDAWVLTGGAVDHDMIKARSIYRDHVRKKRSPLLEEQDKLWNIAQDTANTTAKAEIKIRRQALRDAPADTRIEGAVSVKELMALDVLKAV